ncbi:hypothetical protein BKA62DRAFT_700357 [Auriculariales sp. MPI-PUGE-AT-0066]|nr:hypothetical protein BKA62DRAFT_700357 [Auriculariales sp. MPI-PUGE-AT-0066]
MIIDTQNLDSKRPPQRQQSNAQSVYSPQSARSPQFAHPYAVASTSGTGSALYRQADSYSGEDEPSSPRGYAVPTQPLLAQPPPPNYQTALVSPVVTLPQDSFYRDWEEAHVKRAVERRFFRAFTIGLVIWVLFVILGKLLTDVTINISNGSPNYPSEGTTLQCHKGSNSTAQWRSTLAPLPSGNSAFPKYRSELNMTIPLDRPGYFMLTAGQLTYGQIIIEQIEPPKKKDPESNEIEVSIEARYYEKEAFHKLNICELQGDGESRGLGVYTPSYYLGNPPAQNQIELRILYRVPSRYIEDVSIPSFHINAPHFHIIGLELPSVHFGTFIGETASATIAFQRLRASDLALKTTNGIIYADILEATDHVEIATTNAEVEIKDLRLEGGSIWKAPTAAISSTNNRVSVGATLGPTKSTGKSSNAFGLNVNTSNGPAILAIKRAPVPALLNIEVTTSNANAQVAMYPSFEGSMHLRGRRTSVDVEGFLYDWTGKGRSQYAGRRDPNAPIDDGEWVGQLGWQNYEAEIPRNYGSLEIRTVNGNAAVTVPCVFGINPDCEFYPRPAV